MSRSSDSASAMTMEENESIQEKGGTKDPEVETHDEAGNTSAQSQATAHEMKRAMGKPKNWTEMTQKQRKKWYFHNT